MESEINETLRGILKACARSGVQDWRDWEKKILSEATR